MKIFLIALAAAAFLVIAGVAHAYELTALGSKTHGDGSTTYYWELKEDDGTIHYVFSTHDEDGKRTNIDYVNPNPEDDGATVKGDTDSLIALALQKGGKMKVTVEFAKTPIGKYLISKGAGLVTVYQPGDDDNPGGPGTAPPSKEELGKFIKEAGFEAGGKIGGIEFHPNSGGVKGFVNKNKGKKGKKGGGGKPSKSDSVGQGAMWGDLPGPPELVNPNPVWLQKGKGKQPSAAMSLPSAAAVRGPATRQSAPSAGGAVGKLR